MKVGGEPPRPAAAHAASRPERSAKEPRSFEQAMKEADESADATAAAAASATTTAAAAAAAAAATTAANIAAAVAATTAATEPAVAPDTLVIETQTIGARGLGGVQSELVAALETAAEDHDEAAAIGSEIVDATFTTSVEPVADLPLRAPEPAPRHSLTDLHDGPTQPIGVLDGLDPGDLAEPAAPAPVAHARLVLGHDDDRVVVSVAMRHETVDVAVRTSNVDLATAVSRSLDQLDGALRNHGMSLGDLVAGDHRGSDHPSRSPQARAAASDDAGDAGEPSITTDPRLRALA